jgi:acetyl esterase/lipase
LADFCDGQSRRGVGLIAASRVFIDLEQLAAVRRHPFCLPFGPNGSQVTPIGRHHLQQRLSDHASAPKIILLSAGEPNVAVGIPPDRVLVEVSRAELHVFEVADPLADVLICCGGGYTQLFYDKEGVEVARWLNAAGLSAYVLIHRLPGTVSSSGATRVSSIALDDAISALAHVQTKRPYFVLGLSSGGHLAGVVACQGPRQPDGLLIAYGPINANHRNFKAPAEKPDYPPPEKQAFYDAWPILMAGEPEGIPSCPVFLAYALHDRSVPIEHAVNSIITARDLGLDLDAHVLGAAPHGFALRDLEKGSECEWPGLAERWIHRKAAEAMLGQLQD